MFFQLRGLSPSVTGEETHAITTDNLAGGNGVSLAIGSAAAWAAEEGAPALAPPAVPQPEDQNPTLRASARFRPTSTC